MPGSIKIDDGSGNYTILTNAGSLGSDKTLTIPNETATLATTTATDLGGLVKLQSATASSSSTFTFDNFADSSTYSGYRVVFDSVLHSADNNSLYFKFRSGGASGSDMTGTYYRYFNYITNTSNGNSSGTQTNYGYLSSSHGQDTGESYSFNLSLNLSVNGMSTLEGGYFYKRHDGNFIYYDIMGSLNTTTTITGLKLYPSTGNFASGSAHIYGVKK